MIDQSVGDVMSDTVETITPGTTASELARLFADRAIGSAFVVDPATEALLGIVTESDVMGQVASDADVVAVRVDSFMSSPVWSVGSGASIHVAATLMRDHSVRRLPVVDGDDLVGVLTTTDLTHYLPRLRNSVLRGRGELAGQ